MIHILKQCYKWHILTLCTLALTAIILSFNPDVQRLHNSDSITFSIASYDKWSPYYYGQDRLGMFHSLIASWIKHPLLNLLFINSISVCFTFAMFFAITRWFVGKEQGFKTGLVATSLYALLSITCPIGCFITTIEQPQYSASLFFAFLALILIEQKKAPLYILATSALLLSAWMNIAAPVFAGGLITLKLIFKQLSLKQYATHLAFLLLAFFSILIPTKLFYTSELQTPTSIVPPSQWLTNLTQLSQNALTSFFEYLGPIAALYLIYFALFANKSNRKSITLAPIICLLGALGFFVFLASLSHIGGSQGLCRSCYSTPILFLLICGASIPLHHLLSKTSYSKHLFNYTPLLLLIVTTITIGIPNTKRIELVFEEKWGEPANLIIQHDCTLIGGYSGHCYDILFYTNYKYYQQNSPKRIFPYTTRDELFRADAIQHLKSLDTSGTMLCYMPPKYPNVLKRTTQRGNGIIVDTPAIHTANHYKIFSVQVSK